VIEFMVGVTAGGPKTNHPGAVQRLVERCRHRGCFITQSSTARDSGASAQRHHHGPSVAGQAVRPTAAACSPRSAASGATATGDWTTGHCCAPPASWPTCCRVPRRGWRRRQRLWPLGPRPHDCHHPRALGRARTRGPGAPAGLIDLTIWSHLGPLAQRLYALIQASPRSTYDDRHDRAALDERDAWRALSGRSVVSPSARSGTGG
jgi:hypothetical protein